MLQITLINCLSPHDPNSPFETLPFHDYCFDKTMELIKNGDINEIHAFPSQRADKFKDELLNSILKDGYPRKDKLNVMLTSKSGIEYFVVDGRVFMDKSDKKGALK